VPEIVFWYFPRKSGKPSKYQTTRTGHLIKLPKKGNSKEGKFLLSIPGEEQGGFCLERSCIDQIAALCFINEQSLELNSSVYVTFVDFEAFDSFNLMEVTLTSWHPRELHEPHTNHLHAKGYVMDPFSNVSTSYVVFAKAVYYLNSFFNRYRQDHGEDNPSKMLPKDVDLTAGR
jgi:hypothetical protein